MSIASLLGSGEGEGLDCEGAGKASAGRDQAVVWRGPRKTGLIKRFLKDTFWGRMEYLIFGVYACGVGRDCAGCDGSSDI